MTRFILIRQAVGLLLVAATLAIAWLAMDEGVRLGDLRRQTEAGER